MTHLIRTLLLGAAFLAPGFALAADPPEAAPVAALDAGLLAAMKTAAAGQPVAAREAALTPVITQSYDLPAVTQNSVGFLWATLPAAQQQELLVLFTQFTVVSYASQFNGYSGQNFVLLPTEKTLGAEKIVETRLTPGDGSDPTELDYVVTQDQKGAWRITDVLLGGTISQVAVHESDFSALVASGDASALIVALKAKIAKLTAG